MQRGRFAALVVVVATGAIATLGLVPNAGASGHAPKFDTWWHQHHVALKTLIHTLQALGRAPARVGPISECASYGKDSLNRSRGGTEVGGDAGIQPMAHFPNRDE